MLDEKLGKLHFWLVLHRLQPGLLPAAPARAAGDAAAHLHVLIRAALWEAYNMISSIGAFTMAVGMLVFVVNVDQDVADGPRAGNDPWLADTLEWYATSPPPPWNFDRDPVHHQRPAAARPAPPARAGGAAVTAGPGPACSRPAAVAGTGLAVVSGAADWHTAHRAARRRSRCRRSIGLLVLAWMSLRRLLPAARRLARALRRSPRCSPQPTRPPRRRGARLRAPRRSWPRRPSAAQPAPVRRARATTSR